MQYLLNVSIKRSLFENKQTNNLLMKYSFINVLQLFEG
jgi:hypothetical protein